MNVCKKITPLADDLNCYGDPENWRLFKGIIRPPWIKGVALKEGTG